MYWINQVYSLPWIMRLKELAFSDLPPPPPPPPPPPLQKKRKKEKKTFVSRFVILMQLYRLHYFLHLLTNFIQKKPQSLWVKNWEGRNPVDHTFSDGLSYSSMLQYITKSSLHRDKDNWWQKWLQSMCISSATCMQNLELPDFYPGCQRHLVTSKWSVGKEQTTQ